MDLLTSVTILFGIFLKFTKAFFNDTITHLSNGEDKSTQCTLKDGTEGICLPKFHCIIELRGLDEFYYPQICNSDTQDPKACCIDCRALRNFLHGPHEDEYQSYVTSVGGEISKRCLDSYYKKVPCRTVDSKYRYLDNSIMCYAEPPKAHPIIAGGDDAHRDEFPHMALIGYGPTKSNADWMCGGSVITDQFILTAAHCISSPALGKIKYAALGVLGRGDPSHFWQIYDIAQIIAPPGYKPPSKYDDIALLKTATRIRYNYGVLPACVNRNNDRNNEVATVAIATGWGALGPKDPLADTMQVVTVKKFTDKQCSEAFPIHRHLKNGYDRNRQICYGDHHKVKDTCQGDSGGPLQVKTTGSRKLKCLYTIIGVTSYGKSCGFVGSPGMYTRVSYYVPWIESITGPLPR